MHDESRRQFLKSSVSAACAATLSGALAKNLFATTPSPAALHIKKGILLDMLPANLSYAERLKLAREIGFDVLQAPTQPDEHKAEELKKAADTAEIRIDSVMNMDHWKYPLSSDDPAVVEKSLAGSFESADFLSGCVDPLATRDPQAPPSRRRAKSCNRHRRSLEPVSAEPAGDGQLHR